MGVAKANNLLELAEGLTEAFKLDTKVLVEEFIDGHEVECAVLGNLEPQAFHGRRNRSLTPGVLHL